MAEIVFHRDAEPLLRLPIDRDRFSIGSASTNHLVIPDQELASEEIVVELRANGWWLVDASGRGTRMDATLVRTDAPLSDGAVVTFGNHWSAVFFLSQPTSPGETRRYGISTNERCRHEESDQNLRLTWKADDARRQVNLQPSTTSGIGKDETNTIVVRDRYVSSFHARLVHRRGSWHLSDLGSTNGTFVDGVRVSEAVIEPGMQIRVGETLIETCRNAGDETRPSKHGIITNDPTLLAVLEQIERIGPSEATVTLFGESGTGKELAARAVHDFSARANGPFIPVNCAAISKELMESELFGHEKGAFTGASSARTGAFEEAASGTLFLDEVGELPLDLQSKLLRAIEMKEVRRVGASRPTQVDARIVAATNRDLHSDVRAGRFREDLFYRLYVVPLTLPPLRRRMDDVMLLTRHFLAARSPGRPPSLTDGAKRKLLSHSWPGNVRELKNTIERALLFHRSKVIEDQDITFPEDVALQPEDGTIIVIGKTLEEIELEAISLALRANGGNRRMTAQSLGIARSTLQMKLKEIEPLESSRAG